MVQLELTGTVQLMVFGHNTNVKIGSTTFHVQTEDRGETNALIDTTVYYQGRVLHRRTNNYFDLLPLDEDRQQALKLRLDEQHNTVLAEVQSGALQLAIPQPPEPKRILPPAPAVSAALPASAGIDLLQTIFGEKPSGADGLSSLAAQAALGTSLPRKLSVELLNPKSWLAGRHVTLQLLVKEENGAPVVHAHLTVQIEGAAEEQTHTGSAGINGKSQIEFDMPKLSGPEPAILIKAEESEGKGQLRFALRAKSKVPTA